MANDPDRERAESPNATAHDSSIPPGTRFGRYELIRVIGSGGMGSVYEARHVVLDKRVALKLLSRKLSRNKVYLERFLREGRIAARLDHPHVVSVSDVGMEDGSPFLVMELLSGTDLDTLLEQRGRLSVSEAIDLVLPILSALDAAHRAGLVHRDLKPANIFLARAAHGGFHPKLLDFGIAKPNQEESHALTGTSEVFGTPQYMAPEQVRRSRDATAKSDEYAIAAVLYRCLVGHEAYPLGESSVFELLERVVSGTFPPPRSVRAELPEMLERILLRAMSKNPDDRFASIRELGGALLPFASSAARALWEPAFASMDALAETLGPERLSTPSDRSDPGAASQPERSPRSRETLVAASADTNRSSPSSPGVRPARMPMVIGIAIGAIATTIAAIALLHRGAPPATSSAALLEHTGASTMTAATDTTSAQPAVTPNTANATATATVTANTATATATSSPAEPIASASGQPPTRGSRPSLRPTTSTPAPSLSSAATTTPTPPAPSSSTYPIR
ncbi:MAG: serine/threonine-protein kinase [Polyangiaceae bacterium]